ncbi:hypothetical protein MSAN_02053800 [Mycena sanguinolenta]|uniref:Uncharacterized protein n=1 Tax=Mycena sanguinolenta TaxID=230812 RepID=A0A8H6XJH9_9AGAR|nr:hypothetical protein MSAN_02053800 [Mycena sanguinolenta]
MKHFLGAVASLICPVVAFIAALLSSSIMPTTFKTIQAVSAPRARASAPARAPLTAEEKKEKRDERAEKQENIDRDVAEWFSYTEAKAIELAKKYDKRPRYFLDIFFQGGAHMVNHQEKVNPYNAFKAEKAAQRREDGETGMKVQELHEEYKEEYEALTATEKAELVARFEKIKEDIPKIRRDTPKARVQDVANTVRNIEALFRGLSYRVGVEGFFCIVRNTTEFYMGPQWYFTSDAIRQYMPLAVRRKWDTGEVGTRLEAFAVAGCDAMSLLQNNRQKVTFLKNEIRDRLLDLLVAITGNPNIRMDYIYFEECIVLKYGIDIVGWTCARFVNPSDLSSSLTVLTTLRDAIRDGTCKFVKLTAAERKARREKWNADVVAGTVIPRSRATRSDAGVKRKASERDEDDDEVNSDVPQEDDDTGSGPVVEEPADDPTPAAAARPTKRRKTAKASSASTKPRAAPKSRAAAKSKPARERRSDAANKENGDGLGRRDDEVTRAAAERLKRRTKSRSIIEDDEDDDGVPPSNGTLGSALTSITPNPAPLNIAHSASPDAAPAPSLDAAVPDHFLHCIDPRLLAQ